MFYVYILKSLKTSKYYAGCTENLEKRLNRHNSGQVTSTSTERPWTIIYSETFPELISARKREAQIKRWKSREAIERLIKFSAKSRVLDSDEVGIGIAKV